MNFNSKTIVYNGYKIVAKKMYNFMLENQIGTGDGERIRAKVCCDFMCDTLAASCDTNRVHKSHEQYRKVKYWHSVKEEINKLYEANSEGEPIRFGAQ